VQFPYHCIASSWIVCFGVNHYALGFIDISSLVNKDMAYTIYTTQQGKIWNLVREKELSQRRTKLKPNGITISSLAQNT
jgi:hypothetical protein